MMQEGFILVFLSQDQIMVIIPFGHLIRPAKTVADAAPHEAGGSYRTRLSRMADPKSPGEGDWLSGLIITRRNERWKNSKKILYKNCY